jgi:hypothetical protein
MNSATWDKEQNILICRLRGNVNTETLVGSIQTMDSVDSPIIWDFSEYNFKSYSLKEGVAAGAAIDRLMESWKNTQTAFVVQDPANRTKLSVFVNYRRYKRKDITAGIFNTTEDAVNWILKMQREKEIRGSSKGQIF